MIADEFDDTAIRQLLRLPEDGDLFERVAEWQENQIVGEVRLHNCIHNLLAEPVYECKEMKNGISIRFMMRLHLLAHEAGLKEWGRDNPLVAEALSVIGDPADNSPESLEAARKRLRL
jgi:hypothetical protein